MCTAASKFIRKKCTANSYELLPTAILGYFLIIELVQNVIG